MVPAGSRAQQPPRHVSTAQCGVNRRVAGEANRLSCDVDDNIAKERFWVAYNVWWQKKSNGARDPKDFSR